MRWWHHQLTHLNIHKDWSRNVFPKKCEISKCHNFLISYPIFIIFAPICREIFMLSFEIMVILDWTSPLRRYSYGSKTVIAILFCSYGDWNYWLFTQVIHSVIWEKCHWKTPPDQDLSYKNKRSGIELNLCVSVVCMCICLKAPLLTCLVITIIIAINLWICSAVKTSKIQSMWCYICYQSNKVSTSHIIFT